MRNLKTNLAGVKEFNLLRIENLNEFIASYTNNYDYYKSPFEILADLEKQIKFENNPPETILVDYKECGSIIFDLCKIHEYLGCRFVTYKFSSVAS